jgi:dienelactone hydrolase
MRFIRNKTTGKLKSFLLLTLPFLVISTGYSQLKLSIPAKGGINISADLYGASEDAPYVLLYHQAGSSRGEFPEIARRIVKMGFNCVAVDLRSGGEINYIKNETALAAKERNLPTEYLDSRDDIRTSINYVWQLSKKPVILLGSSYSASLCLIEGKDNPHVSAIIAFSPGEYFGEKIKVGTLINDMKKPVFAACTGKEFPYMLKLFEGVPDYEKTLVKPAKKNGRHGASMLWESSDVSDEMWLPLMVFFRSLKDE